MKRILILAAGSLGVAGLVTAAPASAAPVVSPDPFGIGCSPALLCSIAGTPQRFIGSVEDNTGLVGTPGRFVGGIVDTPRRFVCGPAGEDPDACENGLVGTPGRFVNGIVGTPQRFVTGIVTTPQRFVTGIVTTPQRFVGGLTAPFSPIPAP